MKKFNVLMITAVMAAGHIASAATTATGAYGKNNGGNLNKAQAPSDAGRTQSNAAKAASGASVAKKNGGATEAFQKPAAKPAPAKPAQTAQSANDRLSAQASKANIQMARAEGASSETLTTLETIDKNIDSPKTNEVEGKPLEKLKAVSMEILAEGKSNVRKFGKAMMDTVVSKVLAKNKISKQELNENCKI